MTTKQATQIFVECMAAAQAVAPQRVSGCGRVYIVPASKEAKSALRRACKATGKRWIPKAYGIGADCMYFGYDNATGRELAQGEVFAAALTAKGINCYMDCAGD